MKSPAVTRVIWGEEGARNWVYRINMFTNLTLLGPVLRVLCLLYLVLILIMGMSTLRRIDLSSLEILKGAVLFSGGFFLCLVVLCLAVYYLTAVICGGSYVTVFSMNENAIAQFQPLGRAAKERALALFSYADAGTVSSLTAEARLVVETKYEDILSLTFVRHKGEIRVHSFLTWYSIYVNPEDFALVEEFITARSANAGIHIR